MEETRVRIPSGHMDDTYEVVDVVETLLWNHVIDNCDDSYVIAKAFVKALGRQGYKIVKVETAQPDSVD